MSETLNTIAQLAGLVFVVGSMLAMGLSLTVPQIIQPLKNKRLVILALVANFIIVPALAYGITAPFLSARGSVLGEDDLDTAIALSAIAGQLEMISSVVTELDMPVLAAVLDQKQDELHDLAVDEVFKAAALKTLSAAVESSGVEIGALGVNEMAEGLTRLAAAEALAEESSELAEDAAVYTATGFVEMAAAEGMHDAAEELAAEGITEIAAGSAELGYAAAKADMVEELEDFSS